MKYKNDEYHARYGSALLAAQNLATLLCLELKAEPALLPPALREGLNAPSGNLILLPYANLSRPRLETMIRETRSTVLIIERGATMSGAPTFYMTLLVCRGGEVLTHAALRLWVDLDKQAFLVPDAHGENPDGQCFAINGKGADPVPPPFAHEVDRDMGMAHADAILLAP